MSADIGPGDFVECVDNNPLPGCDPFGPTESLTVGALYTVERILWQDADQILHLKEVKRDAESVNVWGPDVGYGVERFRPIYRPKPDAFSDLLKVPDRKREKA